MLRTVSFVLVSLVLWASLAQAGVKDSLAYQGRLLDAADKPVTGNYDVTFSFWTDSTGGTQLYSELRVVPVSNGLFNICLGCASSDAFFAAVAGAPDVFLQVQMAGQAPMSPRTRLRNSPSAMLASRVRGDVSTAPGTIVVGDTTTGGSLRVNAGLQAAGSALAQGASLIRQTVGGDSSVYDQSEDPASSRVMVHKIHRGEAARVLHAVYPDSTVFDEGGTFGAAKIIHRDLAARNILLSSSSRQGPTDTQSVDIQVDSSNGGSARLAIKTKGTSAKRCRAGGDCDDTDSRVYTDCDDDGDGVADSRAVQSSSSEGSSVTLDAKGGGGGGGGLMGPRMSTNLTVGRTTQSTSFGQSIDLDNDGVTETSMSSTVARKSGSIIYLDREGSEVLRSMVSVDSTKGVVTTDRDSDGDGIPEDEAKFMVLPGSSSVAIKTKGTGADKNRSAITNTADSAQAEISLLSQGDTKYKLFSVTGQPTPVGEASTRLACGDVSDGHDDRWIIDATGPTVARQVIAADLDGDGLADRKITEDCDDTDASIAIDESGVHVAMTSGGASGDANIAIDEPGVQVALARKGWDGTIKGNMHIVDGAERTVNFDGDGTGYVSKRFGIGTTDPTNPLKLASGALCTPGGVWTNASDKNLKENFQPVDGQKLLEKVEQLPISEWNYKNESDDVKHIGPTAQDFKAVFGVGVNDKTISTIDPSGIALAAIKELGRQNRELQDQNAELKRQLDELKKAVNELRAKK